MCITGQLKDSARDFVGFSNNCQCKAKTPAYSYYHHHPRTRRQTGETFATRSIDCRVLRTRLGQRRTGCDQSQLLRTAGSYNKARRIAIVQSEETDLDALLG